MTNRKAVSRVAVQGASRRVGEVERAIARHPAVLRDARGPWLYDVPPFVSAGAGPVAMDAVVRAAGHAASCVRLEGRRR